MEVGAARSHSSFTFRNRLFALAFSPIKAVAVSGSYSVAKKKKNNSQSFQENLFTLFSLNLSIPGSIGQAIDALEKHWLLFHFSTKGFIPSGTRLSVSRVFCAAAFINELCPYQQN